MYFTSGNDRAVRTAARPEQPDEGGAGIGKLGVGRSNIG